MSCTSCLNEFEFSRAEIEETAKNHGLLTMEIEFSLKCNFNCNYCYAANGGVSPDELTEEEIRDIIVQAKDLGARKIIILGGEPMVYPRIMDMIDFIQSLGMYVEIFTNGTNITPDIARRMFEQDVKVVLKMNSFKKELQDELAGREGAYEIIQSAFKHLQEAGYSSPGSYFAVSTIICEQNYDELLEMWQWLRDRNIEPYFEMVTPQGSACGNVSLDVDQKKVHELFEAVAKLDRTRYSRNWEPQPPLVGNKCLRHQFSCLVTSMGKVMPCVGVNIPVGSIREQSLKDILHDSEVIQDLRNHCETIQGPCGTCEKAEQCYGCRGAAYQLTGSYLASDPMCWRNAKRQDEITRLPLSAEHLIPQQAPMRMVDRLLSVGERCAVIETAVAEDNPFVTENGTLEEVAFMEIMAQAIAALNGFRSPPGDGAPKGFLLGAKNLEVLHPARVGDTLHTSVHKHARFGDFGIIKSTVLRGEEILARGEIKVWHDTSPQAASMAEVN